MRLHTESIPSEDDLPIPLTLLGNVFPPNSDLPSLPSGLPDCTPPLHGLAYSFTDSC